MSAIKNGKLEQALDLIQRRYTIAANWGYNTVNHTVIPIHCEGGYALTDPVIQWIIKHGYGILRRAASGSSLWPNREQDGRPHIPPAIRTTIVQITSAGHALYKKHRGKFKFLNTYTADCIFYSPPRRYKGRILNHKDHNALTWSINATRLKMINGFTAI